MVELQSFIRNPRCPTDIRVSERDFCRNFHSECIDSAHRITLPEQGLRAPAGNDRVSEIGIPAAVILGRLGVTRKTAHNDLDPLGSKKG